MNLSTYYSLKPEVRIKRYPWFCIVMDRMSGAQRRASPIAATILSFFTGFYTIEEITMAISEGIHLTNKNAYKLVTDVLETFSLFLNTSELPEERSSLYNPSDFLYDPEPLPEDSVEPSLPTPTEMILSLTHRCNLRCIYCFNDASEPMQNEMSTTEVLKVIDEAISLEILRCTVTGGEPTLHEAFFPAVERLLHGNIFPYISTNGTCLLQHDIQRLVNLGLPYIQVSLDAATAKTHDCMAVVPGTFDKVTRTISSFAELGVFVRVKAVITPINLKEVPDLIKLCGRLGVRNLYLDQFDPSFTGRGNNLLYLTEQQWKWVEKQVEKGNSQSNGNMVIGLSPIRRKWRSERDIIRCGGMSSALTISPNGDVVACEKLLGIPTFQEGNIRNNTLIELWKGRKVEKVCRPPQASFSEPCSSCEFWSQCGGGCFSHKLLYTEDILSPDPRCWKSSANIEKFGLIDN